ncbi:8-oxoguanine deaminase [Actinophytocola sp.]|uniref:8-oxoguanine deaminase n=1 Tax=Actinophytocola sp. TaxID=1872138 RepID=UPI002D7E22D0|nr:8-oxoguanine deaminase [Actinophytocola sp.]HET9140202.1 8-oxoguanine deaminase [Actinophytocola sp.]
MRTVIEGATVFPVDRANSEYGTGHVVINHGVIEAVGEGSAPDLGPVDERIDGRGCLATPGLVNTHHHLYQWATRGLAQQSDLFNWLVTLYPIWAGLDEEITEAAATAGLVRLAETGATTVADHHYVFPQGAGDPFTAVVSAAHQVGVRLHAVRGSMDRGQSHGGLPPDSIVESLDDALHGTEAAIDRYHDPEPGSMVRVAVGPCSPFSVSQELMKEAADLARRKGVRLHTHLAETLDEERQCMAEFGCTPVEYAGRTGWLGEDVWLAHGIHLSDEAVGWIGNSGTGIAHCPTSNARLGAGIARVRDLIEAGAPVGLGVDGAASNEDGGLGGELRAATYLARLRGGPEALTARAAVWLGTMGGARCLGRQREIGSLEPGKQGDVVLWRLDGYEHAGIVDPVAALVFGPLPQVRLLLVGGKTVVEDGSIRTVSDVDTATALRRASSRLIRRAEEA